MRHARRGHRGHQRLIPGLEVDDAFGADVLHQADRCRRSIGAVPQVLGAGGDRNLTHEAGWLGKPEIHDAGAAEPARLKHARQHVAAGESDKLRRPQVTWLVVKRTGCIGIDDPARVPAR